ncbi:hypothetical protein ACIQU6_40905, partial [Streptomyces sp. NPDC090442]|uniref:hypothetical protein n=1 Tax=Streptomyces sp. NPDC090442 TaxID=3365962 RepID=UPI0037F202C8
MAVAAGGVSNPLLDHLEQITEIEEAKQADADRSVSAAQSAFLNARETLQKAQADQHVAVERTAIARQTLTTVRQYFSCLTAGAAAPEAHPDEEPTDGQRPSGGGRRSARKASGRNGSSIESLVLKELACGAEMTVGVIFEGVLGNPTSSVGGHTWSVGLVVDLRECHAGLPEACVH